MTLHEHGKRLPTLPEYIDLLLPLADSNDTEQVNQFGAVTTGRKDEFFLVQTAPKKYRMMPGPEFSPRLYRGQTKRHPSCKPQLFRNITKGNARQKYCEHYYWTAKRYELIYLLQEHPAVKDIMRWEFDGAVFDFNIQAVAQHYQYKTQMLDFSRNKDIALFFATHVIDDPHSDPRPAIGSDAVLYTVDVRTLWHQRPNDRDRLTPIGVDPLPRSAAQSAFALEMDIGEDLEDMPGVHTETFTVTEEIAASVAERCGSIKGIFPKDPFESLISRSRESNHVTIDAIHLWVEHGNIWPELSVSDVIDLITEGGYNVSYEASLEPTPQEVKEAQEEWEERRSSYIDRIRWRGVSDAQGWR
ncbi:FRG domain-containing protein [Thioalkalivibrio sp. AKL8]|uniref:FRG domain-containing protein n=1 Tax=Thioalkalivibrio sp. AKL8 TaxID=1158156 RepID=UPI0009D94D4A|nr:FRG domain-containing protein [Thioalkalivibrio sp. AKL8]